ncbi:Clp1-domain-containing protein [Meredithblackwellia eburnea MCA 4105]
MSTPSKRKVTLEARQEFRFELEPGEALAITLLQGTAEVFGFELVPGQPHPFGDEVRAAIWSPSGAELEVAGTAETTYVASESPVPTYLNLHLSLARLRILSRPSSINRDLSLPDDEVPSPRIMVVGERGAGKTSLIKSLVNWRIREMTGSGKPSSAAITVVNLDVGEGGWTMPGTLSLVSMRSMLPTTTTTAPLGTALSSGPPVPFPQPTGTNADWKPAPSVDAYAPPVNPLVFWHGHTSPNVNAPLFDLLLKRVGVSLRRKIEAGGLDAWKAGYIIDTPGEWAEKKGMSVVSKAVRELEVNILLVVGNERLHVEMSKLMSTNKTVTVVRVPKSDGASEADLMYQSRMKDAQIRSYFYGGPALTQGVLTPFSIIVKLDDMNVFRVGEAADTVAPSSALPIGAARTVADTGLVALDLTLPRLPSDLLHRVLAIPQAEDDAGEEAIVSSPVLGFVVVSAIDMAKKKATLLSPLPGRLPRKTLLLASLDWQDA